jgi:hypothetical protein
MNDTDLNVAPVCSPYTITQGDICFRYFSQRSPSKCMSRAARAPLLRDFSARGRVPALCLLACIAILLPAPHCLVRVVYRVELEVTTECEQGGVAGRAALEFRSFVMNLTGHMSYPCSSN